LILLCFVMGIGMLIFTLSLLLGQVSGVNFDLVSSVISLAYFSWAIGSFYDSSKVGNFFKALIAYMLGAISFYLTVFILSTVITAML
jgi:hypothetical protein